MNNSRIALERKRFPAAIKETYLKTGETGLIPDYVYEAVEHYQTLRYEASEENYWGGKNSMEMLEDSKKAIAEMIHARPEDIAFGMNTSHALTFVTQNYDFLPGDNVIMADNGFITGRYAFQIRQRDGLEIRYVQSVHGVVRTEDVEALMDEHTKMVFVNLVESSTGFRINVKKLGELCKRKGIWLIADGTQALGVLNIDVEEMNLDFVAGNDYKWMLNFCGCGYAYIRPKLRRSLSLRGAGWMSDKVRFGVERWELELRDEAGCFELGYPHVTGIYGLGLVARHYNELGGPEIEEYVLGLAEYLKRCVREKLPGISIWNDYEKENVSQLVFLCLPDTMELTEEYLMARGIAADVRDGKIYGCKRAMRICLHYYNNRQDIDNLVTALKGRLENDA